MKKILLVDDQEDILEILQIYIEGHFKDVVTVTALGGHEAVEIIEEDDIDSIICDYRMPDGDGKVVYDFNMANSHLPFAWHSATFDEDSKKLITSNNSGGHYYILPKPVGEDELITTIQKMIETDRDENVTYRRIRSSILRKFHPLNFDIWISVSGKMMLINKEGDELGLDRIESYETKGVEFFFMRPENYESLITHLIEKLEGKIKRCGTLEDVYFVASEIVDSFNQYLMEKGISADQIKLVDACATRCLRELNKHESIKKIMSGVIDQTNYISSHSLLSLHLANLILTDRDLLKEFATICVLHDLVIKNERLAKIQDFESVDFAALGNREKEVVRNHGAMLVEQAVGLNIPDWGRRIIIHHHKEFSFFKSYKEKVFAISHTIAHFICTESIDSARKWLIDLPELTEDEETQEIVKKLLDIFN